LRTAGDVGFDAQELESGGYVGAGPAGHIGDESVGYVGDESVGYVGVVVVARGEETRRRRLTWKAAQEAAGGFPPR
jgi:hypothetical protein